MTDIVARLRDAVRTADLPFDQIDAERQEAADEIERRLEMHPEKLHLDFRELAMEALADAWPCRKQ